MPELAASWLSQSDEAVFALANASAEIQVVRLGNLKGMASVSQLKTGSYLGRLWGSLSGKAGAGGGAGEAATGLLVQPTHNDVYVVAVCRDHKLRMWSASESATSLKRNPL